MQAKNPQAAEVIGFWFGSADRDKRWFEKNAAFDDEIRARFLALHGEAAAGKLTYWQGEPSDCLALVVLLDQFPRNMFRGSARAFATDALALDAAKHAVAQGYDRVMRPLERMFVYLPFEHAESLAEQERGCELSMPLDGFAETAAVYRYATLHRDIIRRFGRFPHRNAILGRASTPEEIEFLKGPGSSF
jgi:uncharacterized protein (DUF924 family)